MEQKDYLTNEKVCKKFKSQFDLVNYAIRLATNMIGTGRESRVNVGSQNRALQVLGEIIQDKDRFDEIIAPAESASSEGRHYTNHEEHAAVAAKTTERKKSRKILAD